MKNIRDLIIQECKENINYFNSRCSVYGENKIKIPDYNLLSDEELWGFYNKISNMCRDYS